jgi:glycosyltransferase involved in cell wall biosynthesis
MAENGTRPRILVLNQYYWPGVEATAHLLTELCEALAESYEVEVVTGVLHGHEDEPRRVEHNGVLVTRVASTSYDRSRLGRRAVNYLSYLGSALHHALGGPKPDLVLCMTDPPIIGDLGVLVGRRVGAPVLVISQDVFPEIATELDRLTNPAVVGVLRTLVGAYLSRADRIVAIGETMRERLVEKGAPPERLRVIPNWVDTREITPQPRDNEWARQHELVGRFVVMHSGNVGHAQDLDSLVRAATFLRDRDDVEIVIAGFGARHTEMVSLARRLEVEDTVRFLPYQKRSRLSLSLSSADVHVVGLAKGLSGYVVPSRLYGILAAGRPVVVTAEDESETARLVREVECGIVLPPGRPELLARTIRDAADGAYELAEMGRRGRVYVESEADRVVAMERYRTVVHELLGAPRVQAESPA